MTDVTLGGIVDLQEFSDNLEDRGYRGGAWSQVVVEGKVVCRFVPDGMTTIFRDLCRLNGWLTQPVSRKARQRVESTRIVEELDHMSEADLAGMLTLIFDETEDSGENLANAIRYGLMWEIVECMGALGVATRPGLVGDEDDGTSEDDPANDAIT